MEFIEIKLWNWISISIYNFLIWNFFRWFVESVHHHIIVRHSAHEIPHLVHGVLLRLQILSQNLIIVMTDTSTCTSGSSLCIGSSLCTSTRSSCGYKRCSLCGYNDAPHDHVTPDRALPPPAAGVHHDLLLSPDALYSHYTVEDLSAQLGWEGLDVLDPDLPHETYCNIIFFYKKLLLWFK